MNLLEIIVSISILAVAILALTKLEALSFERLKHSKLKMLEYANESWSSSDLSPSNCQEKFTSQQEKFLVCQKLSAYEATKIWIQAFGAAK